MPSANGNYSVPNPPPPGSLPPGHTWEMDPLPATPATDLHIEAAGGTILHVYGAGIGGNPLLGPRDPGAQYNVEGQDSTSIDFSNISVAAGQTFDFRIEATSAGGKLPDLKVHWTRTVDHEHKRVQWKEHAGKRVLEKGEFEIPPTRT
jgi:hypothetical protein